MKDIDSSHFAVFDIIKGSDLLYIDFIINFKERSEHKGSCQQIL